MGDLSVREIVRRILPHLPRMWEIETDESLNDLSQQLIGAFKREHGDAWLGKINLYDEDRNKPVIWKWDGSSVHDFEAAFVLPAAHPEIERMIIERDQAPYTGTADDRIRIDAILDAVERAGGQNLFWT